MTTLHHRAKAYGADFGQTVATRQSAAQNVRRASTSAYSHPFP